MTRTWDSKISGTGPSITPRVCFLGDGVSGSWQIRARQIAATRLEWAALATRKLRERHLSQFDLFCFVKRFDRGLAASLRSAGKRVVYDMVDPWKQPDDGLIHHTLPAAISYFRRLLAQLPVDGVIFPNAAMKADLGSFVPRPTVIYHHHRPDLTPISVKPRPQLLAYEGVPGYLGPWQEIAACAAADAGLRFVVNPRSLQQADIGLAARGGPHGSLMACRYKSNVKLANFLAAGIPCLVHAAEMSYQETANGEVRFFRDAAEFVTQLNSLLDSATRQAIHDSFLAHARRFSLDQISQQYESYFAGLLVQQAVGGRQGQRAAA